MYQLEKFLFSILLLLVFLGGWRRGFEIAQLAPFGLMWLIVYMVTHIRARLKPQTGYKSKIFIEELVTHRWLPKLFAVVVTWWAASYVVLHWVKYAAFVTGPYDFGYIYHAVWSQYAKWFEHVDLPVLYSSMARSETYLSEHFAPILAIISPFLLIYKQPTTLFIVHIISILSGALIIFKLVHDRLKSRPLAASVGLAFLCYPAVTAGLAFDFREDVFFIPLLTGLLWLVDSARQKMIPFYQWIVFVFLLFALLGVKENAPIVVVLIGALTMFSAKCQVGKDLTASRNSKFVFGSVIILTSIFSFYYINSVLTPLFSTGKMPVLASRLQFLKPGQPFDNQILFQFIVHEPFAVAINIFKYRWHAGVPRYVAQVFLPLLLPLLWILVQRRRSKSFPILRHAHFYMALAYAAAAFVLVAVNGVFTGLTMGYHYELWMVPFVFMAIVNLLASVSEQARNRVMALVLLGVLSTAGRSPTLSIRELWPTNEAKQLAHELEAFKLKYTHDHNGPIVAVSGLFAHLLDRKEIYIAAPDTFKKVSGRKYYYLESRIEVDRYGSITLAHGLDLARSNSARGCVALDTYAHLLAFECH